MQVGRIVESARARASARGRQRAKRREQELVGRLEGNLISRLVEMLAVDVVVDVGANRGQTVQWFRHAGFRGDIVSFEPTSEAYAELVRRCASDDRWTGHRMALGATSGRLEINRYEQDVFSSFLSPSSFGKQRFDALTSTAVERETVQVERLDAVWSELVPEGVALLKIDTQGFDLEVLRGAGDKLLTVAVVQLEAPVTSIYDGMPTLQELVTFLAERGFEPAGFFPVTRDRHLLRLVEANCLFVRTDLLDALGT